MSSGHWFTAFLLVFFSNYICIIFYTYYTYRPRVSYVKERGDSGWNFILYVKEPCAMSRRRGIMSSKLKEELAKELGFYDTVQAEGWGAIRAKDAGNMVKRAVELAQQQLKQ